MSHRPREKNANQHSLQLLAAEEFDFGLRTIHINLDLLKVERLVARRHLLDLIGQILHCGVQSRSFEVMAHNADVFFAFTRNSVIFDFLVNRDVVAQ